MSIIDAFNNYENIRQRLPQHPCDIRQPHLINSAVELIDKYDTFLFDAFGVLNIGATAIPAAIETVATLRKHGKNLCVVSNAATYCKARAVAKFTAMGFDFNSDEIVNGRDTLLNNLKNYSLNMLWGAIAPREGQQDLQQLQIKHIFTDENNFFDADGFLFLSTCNWDAAQQRQLIYHLKKRPRPILLANPDLIAPFENSYSLEPGHYVLLLEDELFANSIVYGKPFANIFDLVAHNFSRRDKLFERRRSVLFGDTLHTDILGANANGIASALVAGHGFFKGIDVAPYCAKSGIYPDYITMQI